MRTLEQIKTEHGTVINDYTSGRIEAETALSLIADLAVEADAVRRYTS